MPRIRSIKPEFPQSETMGRVSREARLTFILLWTQADDSGRLRGSSRMLASVLYPYDDDAPKLIDGWLGELADVGAIIRYQVDGNSYVQICNWLNHQKIDKPSPSRLPEFDESSRILSNPREHSTTDLGSRIRDLGSRIEDLGSDTSPTATDRVFDHWRSVHDHPKAKLDAKRRKAIQRALKDYSEADLCLAITGYLNSPHHMGQNETGTRYDDIELMLRDAKHIDAGIKFHVEPPRTDLSKLARQNVSAVIDWLPEELRNAGK